MSALNRLEEVQQKFKPTGFEDSQTKVQIPALSLINCVTLGKQWNLPEFRLLKRILTPASWGRGEDQILKYM